MLILLPPSETKRAGGTGRSLSVDALRYRELDDHRDALVDALIDLAASPEQSITALKLGRTQHSEVAVNGALRSSPTMPALDRYTGVLFDALDAASLTPAQRAFADSHVAVHSALFGLIHALDPIPAYRLSHSSRIPGLSLKKHWREAVSGILATRDDVIVDMRSEGYAELGLAPRRPDSCYLRVLADGPDGSRRALNHFNKKAKGEFARALIAAEQDFETLEDLCAWAADAGFRVEPDEGELALIV
ncbi:YaaA family protein [Microbacterium sp. MPKO10]|uniref:YaaA family protein n=1 Tax=Microbacterium sp. MPKO10 TaxID=2989818 RepID=UPI002236607A|nr:peroxide stress protein YaaA [Microbacterium sp. MPKO10]MCW4458365.1 peroxide stress protein YaaA [Microbacterium sp. MPKO10]